MLSKRYEHLRVHAVHDTRIAVDLRRHDPRLAIDLALFLGPVVVVVVAIIVLPISLRVMARAAVLVPDWPMPF